MVQFHVLIFDLQMTYLTVHALEYSCNRENSDRKWNLLPSLLYSGTQKTSCLRNQWKFVPNEDFWRFFNSLRRSIDIWATAEHTDAFAILLCHVSIPITVRWCLWGGNCDRNITWMKFLAYAPKRIDEYRQYIVYLIQTRQCRKRMSSNWLKYRKSRTILLNMHITA